MNEPTNPFDDPAKHTDFNDEEWKHGGPGPTFTLEIRLLDNGEAQYYVVESRSEIYTQVTRDVYMALATTAKVGELKALRILLTEALDTKDPGSFARQLYGALES